MCVPKEEQFGLQKIGGLEQSYNEAHFFLVTNRLVGFGVVMIYKFITGFVVIFESHLGFFICASEANFACCWVSVDTHGWNFPMVRTESLLELRIDVTLDLSMT